MRLIFKLLFVLQFSFILYSCEVNPYLLLEKRELETGLVYDSLFLGVKFKMTSKEFYAHCWDLNKKEVITQGPSNNSVRFILQSKSTDGKIEMLFYPVFNNDTIYELNSTFSYIGWAPWNKNLFSDFLIEEVKEIMEEWYGSNFITIKNSKNDKMLYATVNGNRRIAITIVDDSKVRVRFINLLVEKTITE